MTGPRSCMCGGTGWITRVDPDGYGYDEPCPNGCPQPNHQEHQ